MRHPAQGITNRDVLAVVRFLANIIIYHRAVVRIQYGIIKWFLPPNINYFNTLFYFIPLVVIPVLIFTIVLKTNLVPIQHVGINVCYTPADLLIITDHHARRTG